MKRIYFPVIGALLIAVLLTFVRGVSNCSRHVLVVEFTYSRVQPCNEDYYNYAYSIGPLEDLMTYWRGEESATRHDFQSKVGMRFRRLMEAESQNLSDAAVVGLCQNVTFEIEKSGCFCNPIKCKMCVRADCELVSELLAKAYKEAILEENELVNQSMSWKATMDLGCDVKRREHELRKLKGRLACIELTTGEMEKLHEAINVADAEVGKSREAWNAAVRTYRKSWDSSIVFVEN